MAPERHHQGRKSSDAGDRQVEQSVGIDLGLKEFAATIDGYVITLDRHYRKLAQALAKAQPAYKKAKDT